MAKIRPEGMKTTHKSRVCWGTWKDDDPKNQEYNLVNDEDREKYKKQLEEWTKKEKEQSND